MQNISTTQFLQFVQNHPLLWLAFLAILSVLLFEEFRRKFKPSNYVSPNEAVKLINHEAAVIVDIRDNQAFKTGHIVNAINIHQSELEKSIAKLAAHKEMAILLVANKEPEAQKIAEKLKAQKFGKIYILADGFSAWQNANLPVIK